MIPHISASLLLVRWDRALNTREVAAETMHQLMPGQHYHGMLLLYTSSVAHIIFPAKTVADQVNQWLAKEIAVCQEPSAACSSKKKNHTNDCMQAFQMHMYIYVHSYRTASVANHIFSDPAELLHSEVIV